MERYAVHASYEDAAAYASDNPVAYPGQIIAVVETSATSIYYIDQNMDLQPVGTLPTGDGKTISIDDNGVVSLYGINGELDSAKSYQPVYNNGTLSWVELSSTTVEGLQTLIEALQDDVDALEASLTKLNANSSTVGSIDYKIAQAVAAIMENPDETMNSINELVTWCNEHAEDALELSNKVTANENDIAALEALVGSTAVATQITNAINAALKIDGADKYALATSLTAAIARVATLETDMSSAKGRLTALEAKDAEKNVINSVDTDEFTVDASRKLSINAIPTSKVTGLPEALADKVDKVEGSRLLTAVEAGKLEKLVIGEDGSVEVSGTIAAGNVDGLAEWINTRAATLKGLSENNLTDALKQQILNSQANVIEVVKVGGTAIAVNTADKSVEIPGALQSSLGVVKGTTAENGISITSDHTMLVNSLNVNKLVQTDGDTFVLDGGSSAD